MKAKKTEAEKTEKAKDKTNVITREVVTRTIQEFDPTNKEHLFYCNEHITVIYYGKMCTRVVLGDGTTGHAWKKRNDKYNVETGIAVAFLKAKNKQAKKQIKALEMDIAARIDTLKAICSGELVPSDDFSLSM